MQANDYHCCSTMKLGVEDTSCPLYYSAQSRAYGVSVPRSLMKKYEVWKGYGLQFCPNCGAVLPADLTEMRFDILEYEYGLDQLPFDEKQEKMIPEEFRTNEWWKKRGL